MSKRLPCASIPCGSCPYRRDTPPGIWDAAEYERLRDFADKPNGIPSLGVFLCHQSPFSRSNAVCRGWLSVERESIAVRLALIKGIVTQNQVEAEVRVPLYTTGAEAAAAGLAGVEAPGRAAQRVIRRLIEKKARRKD